MDAPQRPNPREDVKRILLQVQAKQPFQIDPFFEASSNSPSPTVPAVRPPKPAPRKSVPLEVYSTHDYEWAAKPLKPRRKPSTDQHMHISQVPFEK